MPRDRRLAVAVPVRVPVLVLGFVLAGLSRLGAPAPLAAAGAALWRPIGPEGGTVTALAAIQSPLLGALALYAGGAAGVWNGPWGERWTFASTPLAGGSVTAMVTDAAVLPWKIYATTQTGGVWKSSDGGATWAAASAGLPVPAGTSVATSFTGLAIERDSTLYASYLGEVWKTTDAAASWSRVLPPGLSGSIFALAFDSSTRAILAGCESGVVRSTDGGATWQVAAFSPPPGSRPPVPVITVLALPRASGDLYGADLGGGVWRSRDGGATWAFAGPGPGAGPIRSLAIDPRAGATLYAGTAPAETHGTVTVPGGVYRSTDGGTTWKRARRGLDGSAVLALLAAPRADSLPTALFAGTERGGVYQSSDGGAHWQPSRQGLAALEVDRVAADPRRPGVLYAGAPGGLYATGDGGASWQLVHPSGSATVGVALNPNRPAIVYHATTGEGVAKSRNGGLTWRDVLPPLFHRPLGGVPFTGPLAIDAARPASLYLGLLGWVAWTADAGSAWSPAILGTGCTSVQALAVDASHPGTVYAGGVPASRECLLLQAQAGGVWKSVDGGKDWSQQTPGAITDLAIDPADPATVYAASGPGVALLKTRDGGAGWTPFGDLPGASALAVDPALSGTLYADGWVSRDGGATFLPNGGDVGGGGLGGLGGLAVRQLALAPASRTLYAATRGGLFALPLSPP